MSQKNVVIGILGMELDSGQGADRWAKWRPTVGLCQHEDLLVNRLELIHDSRRQSLADRVAEDIASVSPETQVHLHRIDFRDAWDFEEVYAALHEFARGYRFDPESENYLIHITTGTHVAQICLFLLTESRHLPGRLLQTSPARRETQPAAGLYRIIDLDLSNYDRLAARFELEHKEGLSFLKSGIDTRNGEFNRLIEQIERVAVASAEPILLAGPTGAGKSQLARRVFELKRQRMQFAGAMVEVNCATLRGDQAMSTLFGHVKGAFTGATSGRDGLLRTADGGLLFLDEIGELRADEQAMLLRAIEEKRFLPVGSDREVTSDFQLVAGTNRDLQSDVMAGRFREDLLARINLWTFRLPGLAQRRKDIEPNVQYELQRYTERTGKKVSFNKQAYERFLKFAMSAESIWTANFRDLNAAIGRMATLAAGGRINLDVVDDELQRLRAAWHPPSRDEASELLVSLLGNEQVGQLDRFDRAQLTDVIRVCRESASLSEAGCKLFSISRRAKQSSNDADRLRKYLQRFGLSWQQVRD